MALRDLYANDATRTTFFTALLTSIQSTIDGLNADTDSDRIDALQYLYDVINNYLG